MNTKQRGNGTGSVYKLPNGKYKAVMVLGYYLTPDNQLRKRTRSQVFEKKKDAVNALPLLKNPRPKKDNGITFYQLYELWLPTHRAGRSTLDCYKSAIRYFSPLFTLPFSEIDVDDLQDCIDDCPKGKRTKENMRAAVGLMYKYAIPRRMTADGLNLAQFLKVSGDSSAHRDAFTELELARLWKNQDVPYVSDILTMCYTGFRPSEYLALTSASYDPASHTLTGGAKTEAGKNRVVTLSPKILPLVASSAALRGPLCRTPTGEAWDRKEFTEKAFYPALEECGIDNPVVEIAGGVSRHRITPHSCRHTFATLIKRVDGADKDKLELIGHTSGEMLRHYQDVSVEDLKRITDKI